MTDTTAATGLTVKQWDSKFFTEALNSDIFKPFMGTKTNSVIQVKEDLTKKPGDALHFALVNKLSGSGVTGSSTLEGNEEDMASRSFQLTIDQYRNAVRVPVFENQKSSIDLREAAKDVLMDWNMELNRDACITALGSINGVAFGTANATQRNAWLVDNADRVLFGAAKSNNAANVHADALATIDNTSDKLTSAAVSLMKRLAKTAAPRIRPIKPRKGNGTSDFFVLYAPSLLVRDLTLDTAFMQANREARNRGVSNPIFKGADYIFDNVAIYEVEDIPVISGAGASSIDVAPCYLCGAQALGIGWGKRPETKEEEFDYGDKQGIAVRQWYGVRKMIFGSNASVDTDDLKDHGVFTGYFASVAD